MPIERSYNTEEAACFLGVSVQTLAAWRKRGIGPPYVKYPSAFGCNSASKKNGRIVYLIDALEEFQEEWSVTASRMPRVIYGRPTRGKNKLFEVVPRRIVGQDSMSAWLEPGETIEDIEREWSESRGISVAEAIRIINAKVGA